MESQTCRVGHRIRQTPDGKQSVGAAWTLASIIVGLVLLGDFKRGGWEGSLQAEYHQRGISSL